MKRICSIVRKFFYSEHRTRHVFVFFQTVSFQPFFFLNLFVVLKIAEKVHRTVVDIYRISEHAADCRPRRNCRQFKNRRRRKLRKQNIKETSTPIRVYVYINIYV